MKPKLNILLLLIFFSAQLSGLAIIAITLPANLNEVFEPVVVAKPPSDAYIGLSMLENGEIRYYNYGEQAEPESFYLSSMDKGLTWKRVNHPKEIPFADIRSPKSGEYIRMIAAPGMGTYALRTSGGINGNREIIKVTDTLSIMNKPAVFIRNGGRIIVASHYGLQHGLPRACFTYYSDDDGKSWKKSSLITTPDHTGGGIHNGIRWNHGAAEPTVVELADGRLWMLIRTSQDHHYQSFSEDGGETWQTATPSPFYGTITMPTIGKLQDGRLLFLWSNTTPLPEVNNTNGVWNDVFTNRNAIHAAISDDDGKTWTGFRELYLDPRRNAADFGTVAGIDKSVHQSQFIEVEPGKILVSLGQHKLHRAMLLFDVKWLYENERKCDFSDGLSQWSSFNYYKGIVGHCGYNRTEGCNLVDGKLEIRHTENDSLLSSQRGAVWNFPAFRKGEIRFSVQFNNPNSQAKFLLSDRWFNPTDTTAQLFAPFVVPLNPQKLGIKNNDFHEIRIEWDVISAKKSAVIFVNNKRKMTIQLNFSTQHGISYIHFLGDNSLNDKGFIISEIEAKRK